MPWNMPHCAHRTSWNNFLKACPIAHTRQENILTPPWASISTVKSAASQIGQTALVRDCARLVVQAYILQRLSNNYLSLIITLKYYGIGIAIFCKMYQRWRYQLHKDMMFLDYVSMASPHHVLRRSHENAHMKSCMPCYPSMHITSFKGPVLSNASKWDLLILPQ